MSFRNLKIFLLKNKIKINLIKKYCAGLASKMTSFKSWCPIDHEIPINCWLNLLYIVKKLLLLDFEPRSRRAPSSNCATQFWPSLARSARRTI